MAGARLARSNETSSSGTPPPSPPRWDLAAWLAQLPWPDFRQGSPRSDSCNRRLFAFAAGGRSGRVVSRIRDARLEPAAPPLTASFGGGDAEEPLSAPGGGRLELAGRLHDALLLRRPPAAAAFRLLGYSGKCPPGLGGGKRTSLRGWAAGVGASSPRRRKPCRLGDKGRGLCGRGVRGRGKYLVRSRRGEARKLGSLAGSSPEPLAPFKVRRVSPAVCSPRRPRPPRPRSVQDSLLPPPPPPIR